MNKIILASGSPRRRELLSLIVDEFDVKPADVDETLNLDNDLQGEIENLSFKKAYAVFQDHKDSIVIGSDTIVVVDGEILGKPGTEENAKAMLKKLEGRPHQVITGVSIISPSQSESFSTVSSIYFRHMSEAEIEAYAKTKEPLDKAGGYAVQGLAARYIERIDGDYYSIMGLPVCELYHRIQKYL